MHGGRLAWECLHHSAFHKGTLLVLLFRESVGLPPSLITLSHLMSAPISELSITCFSKGKYLMTHIELGLAGSSALPNTRKQGQLPLLLASYGWCNLSWAYLQWRIGTCSLLSFLCNSSTSTIFGAGVSTPLNVRRGAGQNYHMNLVQSAGIQSTHWFCVCAIDHVLTGRNTFLSTFDESPAVPKKGKCKQFASCNKVDPLWRWKLHTTNILTKHQREQTDQIRESSRAGSLVILPLTTHVLCIIKRASGWLFFGLRPELRGFSFTLIWTFPGSSCLTFSEPIPQWLFAFLASCFLSELCRGAKYPPTVFLDDSWNVHWGPNSLSSLSLLQGKRSFLPSCLNRPLIFLQVSFKYFEHFCLTGESSYSATSCLNQGSKVSPLLKEWLKTCNWTIFWWMETNHIRSCGGRRNTSTSARWPSTTEEA